MNELLDSRNQNLWNAIQEKFNVSIENTLDGNYGCYSQNDNVIFYINPNDLCIDSFTHELLHIHLRLKEFYIGAGLKLTINGSRILSSIMSDRLLEHIGNCLDHVKMLPIYLEMGFDRKKFIVDYNIYKCTNEELSEFKKYYRIGKKINLNAVDSYIGRIVSVIADPNDEFDYSKDIVELKKIDPYLYQIFEKLFNDCKQIKLENRSILEDDDHTVMYNFYQNMKTWLSNNKIN